MADEFSGLEFALGSVRGYRRWKITVGGHLEPMSRRGRWSPGENAAECQGYPSKDVVEPKRDDEEHYTEFYARMAQWKANHDMSSCTHGFYAYSATTETYGTDPGISGVIEGYGEVLIGTKGFRAAKARILALSTEAHDGIWNLDQFVINKLRANYPNIPIFESTFAMQLEFPADSEVLS